MALAWLLGLAILVALLWRLPLHAVGQALLSVKPWTWVATLLGLMASYGLRAARLQVVLDLQHRAARPTPRVLGLRLDALRVILLHNAAVNLLPMRAGELSFPWLAARELGQDPARAVVCLLWMRLQDLSVLVGLALLMWPGWPAPWRGAALLAFVLAWKLGLLGLNGLLRRNPSSALEDATPVATGGWRGKLWTLRHALNEPSHHRPAAWLLSLANWALKLLAASVMLASVVGCSLPQAWLGGLGGELAAVLPIQGPAGVGTYELGVWAGFAQSLRALPHSQTHILAAALALHACFLVGSLLAAAGAMMLGVRRRPAPRSLVQLAPHVQAAPASPAGAGAPSPSPLKARQAGSRPPRN